MKVQIKLEAFGLHNLRLEILENPKDPNSPVKPTQIATRGVKTDWSFKTKLGRHDENPLNFQVTLTVGFSEYTPDLGKHGYQGEVTGIAIIVMGDDTPPDKAQEIAHIQGAQIIYGSLRGAMMMLTGAFALGPILFPPYAMADLVFKNKYEPVYLPGSVLGKDDNQQAADLVSAVTGTEKPKGEDLLGSEALKRKLRQAKRREQQGRLAARTKGKK